MPVVLTQLWVSFFNFSLAQREFVTHTLPWQLWSSWLMFPERSTEKADERASRFGIILGQTRALLSFHHLLLKLVGSKEKVTIAKEIQKALKQSLLV